MTARLILVCLGVAGWLAGPLSRPAAAQDLPSPIVEFHVGWAGFADDGRVDEAIVGGAARLYLSPRVSLGPEVIYFDGTHHTHLAVTGNLTVDLGPRGDGLPRRVVPFFVAGVGLFQTREEFPSGPYTYREGAFTVGGGVRVAAGDRFTLGVDARIGWELHLRMTGVVGVRLGS